MKFNHIKKTIIFSTISLFFITSTAFGSNTINGAKINRVIVSDDNYLGGCAVKLKPGSYTADPTFKQHCNTQNELFTFNCANSPLLNNNGNQYQHNPKASKSMLDIATEAHKNNKKVIIRTTSAKDSGVAPYRLNNGTYTCVIRSIDMLHTE